MTRVRTIETLAAMSRESIPNGFDEAGADAAIEERLRSIHSVGGHLPLPDTTPDHRSTPRRFAWRVTFATAGIAVAVAVVVVTRPEPRAVDVLDEPPTHAPTTLAPTSVSPTTPPTSVSPTTAADQITDLVAIEASIGYRGNDVLVSWRGYTRDDFGAYVLIGNPTGGEPTYPAGDGTGSVQLFTTTNRAARDALTGYVAGARVRVIVLDRNRRVVGWSEVLTVQRP